VGNPFNYISFQTGAGTVQFPRHHCPLPSNNGDPLPDPFAKGKKFHRPSITKLSDTDRNRENKVKKATM